MRDIIFFKIALSDKNYIESDVIFVTPDTILTDIPFSVKIEYYDDIIKIIFNHQDYGKDDLTINDGYPRIRVDGLSGRIFLIELNKLNFNLKPSKIKEKINKSIYNETNRYKNNINFGMNIYKLLLENGYIQMSETKLEIDLI